ncbi:MAG: hypothetical protein OEY94_00890 [Alphaproteobacteria bacterium]|nr:hypothetical protein [Alphaproteobacteria bacterium]
MQKILFVIAAFLLINSPAIAEEQKPLDPDLVHDAVQLAAQVDTYNVYCEKESALADGFIERFEKRGLTLEQKEELVSLQKKVNEALRADLAERKPDCKTSDFLLERLKAMRVLKAVSFALNGVDPSTLPDAGANVPLEELLKDPI